MKVVLVTLMATLFMQLGYFLWKISAAELPKVGVAPIPETIRGFFSNKKWIIGLLATIVGWILFVHATEIGAISFVQPLMSVGDIFLVGLAVVFLKEHLTKQEWIGLIMTVIGAAALSAESGDALAGEIQWPRVLFFLSLVFVIFLFLNSLALRNKNPEVFYAILVGMSFGTGSILTKLLTSYIYLSQEVNPSLWNYIYNPLIPFVIISNIAGLTLLQIAFQKGRASVVVPIQISVVNAFAVFAGALFFGESISNYRILCIILITLGTAVVKSSVKT